jgi:hypothetical protein
MEEQPIYLDNFELAMKMKIAGFDKECVHEADFYSEHYNIVWNKSHVERYRHHGFNFDVLQLPTLGEIDLPEDYIVLKNNLGTFNVWRKKVMHSYNSYTTLELYPIYEQGVLIQTEFKTEIEARCHAWLWSNKNKKEAKNG